MTGEVTIQGVAMSELAERFGTPSTCTTGTACAGSTWACVSGCTRRWRSSTR
ncbi:hypothetical protein V2I01_12150 [Micromonospora sp. BRA006-A]|nr:hypothetical protein [Micromonospora sp. BRA006-A]